MHQMDEYETFKQALAANIDSVRRYRFMSCAELSRAAGLSENEVSQVVSGRRCPSAWTVFRLARALGVGIGTLMYREMMGD